MSLPLKIEFGKTRFRNWTIISEEGKSAHGHRMVKAECTCGYSPIKSLTSIANGTGITCNRCRELRGRHGFKKTEKKYGFLTVIGQRPGPKSKPNIEVECVCGFISWVKLCSLEIAGVTSCGCRGVGRARNNRPGEGEEIKEGDMTDTFQVNGKWKTFKVDGSKPRQPKTEAGKMRSSGKCFISGMCLNYRACGDKEFMGKCLGYNPEERKFYNNANGVATVHGGVL